MAEFCEKCADELGFPRPDFNTDEIFGSLMDEHYLPVICEGCALLGIGRVGEKKILIHSQYDLDKMHELIINSKGDENAK
jgi:hypothetical protein